MKQFPIENYGKAPWLDAKPEEKRDSVHTGGAWVRNGEVWKALEGRPYYNATSLWETEEDVCLTANQDLYAFPKTFRVEEANGRRWLVRPEIYIPDVKELCEMLDRDMYQKLEMSLHEFNARGWYNGDGLTLGINENTYEPEWIDFSTARYDGGQYQSDETYFSHWISKVNPYLAKKRQAAIDARLETFLDDPHNREFKYVYASFNRPVSLLWATISGTFHMVQNNRAIWSDGIPWTWLFTMDKLQDDVTYRYELELCYTKWGRWERDAYLQTVR